MSAFVSKPEHLTIHSSGWFRLPSGLWMTKLPIWDDAYQLAARLGPMTSASWCESQNLLLPAVRHYDELHATGLHVEPYTLPDGDLLDKYGIGSSADAIDSFRNANMRSKIWCELHDGEVWSRMEEAGWTDEPVANFGKHWADGDIIYGWWRGDGGMWQGPRRGAHLPTYTDYATTFHALALRAPESLPAPGVGTGTSTPPTPSYRGAQGQAVVLWQAYLAHLDYLNPRDIDGVHGNVTEGATISYMRDCGLERAVREAETKGIQFRQARSYHKGRLKEIRLIVLHTAEMVPDLKGEDTNAEGLMNYCATSAKCSWHYSVDSDSETQSVKDEDTAWGAKGANADGLHIELGTRCAQKIGWTWRMVDPGWDDSYHSAMLERAARLVATKCAEHGIPKKKLTPQQIADGKSGICGHADVTKAYKVAGGHMDPGIHFPWDRFIDLL